MNITDKKIVLKKGTKIAEIHVFADIPIEETSFTTDHEITKNTQESNLLQSIQSDIEKSHLEKLLGRIHPEAPSEEKEQIAKVLTEYQDVFSKPGEIGLVNCYKHKIQLIEGAKPVKKAPYRKPALLEKFERETVQDLLNKGIIRPSHSPWASGVVIVTEGHKNSEGQKSPRLAVGYRNLNSQIQQDSFPLLNIQTVLDWIGSRANFISVMDCSKGFWSIPLEEESIPLTSFICSLGLFEFLRLPFGISTGSQAMQRVISIILCGLMWESVLAFIDDIILADKTIQNHVRHLRATLARFREHGIKLNVEKSYFLKPNIKILGHIISKEGISADMSKVSAILKIPPPQKPNQLKELQHFLGCANYFRRYIANYSTISEPLTKLTRKNIPYIWGTEQEQAFQALKFHLTNPPLLAFYDPDRPIHIQCDASGVGIGSCLMQLNEKGHEQPVAYASKTLNEYQRRYNNTEREFYAIYHALRVFHPYIYGKKFTIFTDHQTITQIKFASQTEKTSNRLTTWALLLQEHNCTLRYRKGSEQKIADGLSRLPIEDPERGNGLSERLNATIGRMIAHFVNQQHSDWDKKLYDLQFAYNTSVQESTKQTPFKIIYGRNPNFLFDFKENINDTSSKIELQELRKQVKAVLELEQQRYKEREDAWRKPVYYEIGQVVKLKYPKKTKIIGQSLKFIPHYLGEYKKDQDKRTN
ncbi:Retrovirus-related Pol polyprotein from transposon opus [Folsomia candida]|uniref:Retrovirus-related Pol polyprotein from transposon opus n=1 Tax=Folsomia candida TaxID=158441 RepID=A0A226DGM3_FOLCA|nr:Retrovirus-related Pol polyprotein from transposon opus [Folsomia candida]